MSTSDTVPAGRTADDLDRQHPRRGASKWHLAAPLVLAVLGPAEARADDVDDLAPGTWFEIPNTPMRDVCPPDTADYDWSFFCQSAIGAWSGGALDTTRGRLIVWGGGHGDYKGNEVYVFDMQTLAWERVWGPSADAQIPEGGTHEQYDDGTPGSRHTYSGLTYVPPPHDALVSMGGSLWQTGFYGAGTWSFSFDVGEWTRLTDGPAESGFGDPSVYDPETGTIFRRGNQRMLQFDPIADVYTERAASDGGFWASNVSAALDPEARTMVILGDGRLDLYHLDTDTYEQDVTLAGAGVSELLGDASPGVGYDSQQGRIVAWGGGLNVYTLDLEALSFAEFEGAGDDPGAITPSGGAFGRFRYVPSRNVFVSVNDVDENVFVFRMSEGMGVPPDPPGGSGSSDGAADDDGAVDDSTGAEPPGGSDADPPSDPPEGGTTSSGTPGGETGGTAGAGEGDDDGCSCRTSPESERGWWLLALGIALVGRRRRGT
ncbi:MAG: MYXO-CTERM sorting domain-containing protein [Myxococcota bacterium]